MGVERCFCAGSVMEYQVDANCEYRKIRYRRQTAGANVRRQEENNPDRRLRSRRYVKWETMWEGIDSQDVGLEAAIIKRKRNSSLVESACAEDVTGLNISPKPRTLQQCGVVGERSVSRRR